MLPKKHSAGCTKGCPIDLQQQALPRSSTKKLFNISSFNKVGHISKVAKKLTLPVCPGHNKFDMQGKYLIFRNR